ncbi:MAG TPA: DUF456 domain-containing protein [Woeseiaceae bacterium]|nr:DUF456 domain-containing protein [Woeseiaceae bacterium]
MIYLYATLLTLLNIAFWAGILFGVPGIWLMVLVAALIEWSQPGEYLFSQPTLYVSAGLALLAELLEFLMGAAGARQAGGSKRGAGLAIVGGIVGAVLGTALPVPVLGTLIGASAGAFAGSLLGDRMAGRSMDDSVQAGRGAAIGRFWGTTAKMIIGAVVLVLLAVAAYFPD